MVSFFLFINSSFLIVQGTFRLWVIPFVVIWNSYFLVETELQTEGPGDLPSKVEGVGDSVYGTGDSKRYVPNPGVPRPTRTEMSKQPVSGVLSIILTSTYGHREDPISTYGHRDDHTLEVPPR